MLDSIYINNFRLFRDLAIDKLRMVNLIVGKNNTGKSCLLEAIRVYAEKASPDVLSDLIADRGQDWESKMKERSDFVAHQSKHPLRHLFYGYRFPEINKNPIEIGYSKHAKDGLKLHLRAYRLGGTEEGRRIFSRVEERVEEDELKESILDDIELVIELEKGNRFKPVVRLNQYPRLHSGLAAPYYVPSFDDNTKTDVQFVPTKHIDDRKVAELWDNINIHPHLRREVFDALKLIDENIHEVVLVGRERYINPVLIYENVDERIPLKSMGDGMTHLFHIILALINSRGGLLLIDEFENGLHYSLQPKIWNLILKLAKKLEIQVFATTHSWDCVNAFQKAVQEQEAEGMLLHLGHSVQKNDEGKIIASTYDKDELQLATQADLEVR